MANDEQRPEPGEPEGVWRVDAGETESLPRGRKYTDEGIEALTYNNPHRLNMERIWFNNRVVFAVESGEVEIAFNKQREAVGNKVAQEYQIVYAVELDERGKLKGGAEPDRVEGQYNIYDSVPGMEKYSALWQFNYVTVPRDYEPNSLRSEADCLSSGLPIERSTVVEN